MNCDHMQLSNNNLSANPVKIVLQTVHFPGHTGSGMRNTDAPQEHQRTEEPGSFAFSVRKPHHQMDSPHHQMDSRTRTTSHFTVPPFQIVIRPSWCKIDQEVINNNDYDSAWRLLEDAYEDERLIIDTHIDALLNLPRLTRENGDEMRKLVETCTKHVDALKNQELPVEGLSEMILINLISKRLDRESRKLWESSLNRGELPSFDDLMEFLKERSRVLQKLSSYTHINQPPATTKSGQQPAASKARQTKMFVQTNKESCPCCSNPHTIYKCVDFKKLTVPERFDKVKRAGLCFNCLRPGHRTVECSSDQHCKTCSKHHHSFLHNEGSDDPKKKVETAQPKNQVEAEKKKTRRLQQNSEQSAAAHKRKALLDCCSESNIITEKLAKRLNMQLSVINPPIAICGLNGMKTTANKVVQTKVSSRDGEFTAVLDFIVTPSITELPTGKVETQNWPLPAGIELADPTFNVPDNVDVIIGAELYYDVLKKGRLKIGSDFPILAETVFGWVVSGSAKTRLPIIRQRVCHLNTTHEDVNRTLSKFWELEAGYYTSKMTAAERAVEQHFEETHSRNSEGRYVVRLPFNDRKSQLGDSYEYAKRRFMRLMISLAKDPSKQESHKQFLQEVSHNSEQDDEGFVRVGGRLKYSNIPYEGKHQLLLPERHPVVELLVRHLHEKNLHVGQNALISIIRQLYWPIKVKMTVKRITSRCYRCFKRKPSQLNQFMVDSKADLNK
nr:uncharacterized protein LOC115257565 [Aedes albopictus]